MTKTGACAHSRPVVSCAPMTCQEVYAEHFRFVWRALRRLGVPERDMPDAVQDVFVVVHRKLPGWEGRSKMTTWLYGICMRVASDRRNLAHVRREVPFGPSEPRVHEGPGVDELLEHHERRALLDKALDLLPIEQRAVFVLFELDELSGEQVAELLALPEGTVWSRLRTARVGVSMALQRLSASGRRPCLARGAS